MTPDEFKAWAAYHRRLHPSYADWAASLPPESAKAISGEWEQILSSVTLPDALGVSRGMLRGTYPHPPKWDYQMLASIVRQLTGAGPREERAEVAEEHDAAKRRNEEAWRERQSLEAEHGPDLDGMSRHEQQELARRAGLPLTSIEFKTARFFLLEQIKTEAQ